MSRPAPHLVAHLWAIFAATMQADTGPAEQQGSRRAFYGGVAALLAVVPSIDDSQLEAIARELEQFSEDVEDGRA